MERFDVKVLCYSDSGKAMWVSDHLAVMKEKDAEVERLKAIIDSVKMWCEGSVCEICGEKKMTDTDCYDYVEK